MRSVGAALALGLGCLLAACDSPETVPASEPRLAIVNEDGDVVTVSADGTDPEVVTANVEGGRLFQPVWSPDGESLAWGRIGPPGAAVAIASSGEVDEIETDDLPFYISWAPDSTRLALLHNRSGGEIDLVMVDADSLSSSKIEHGAPFYFSWERDSSSVVAHIGDDRFVRLGVDGSMEPLGPTDRGYLAPFVTDAGVAHLLDGNLTLGGEAVARVPGSALLVANDDGTRIAIAAAGGGVTVADAPAIPPNRLVVVDVRTGEIEEVSSSPAAGFFWSPEGESLLALVIGDNELIPTVWRPGRGVVAFESFRPPQSFLQEVLPFFPQYAQSFSLWAPDGTAFAYPGEMDGDSGIWIQALDDTAPVRVTDGTWVTWSP